MGQVLPESAFGRAIRSVVSRDTYRTVCEVGTWNGQGTTACLYTGRPGMHVYSIEGNLDMYKQACAFWGDVPNLTLLYGTLHRRILSPSEIYQHPRFPKVAEHYRLHYESEKQAVLSAPLVSVPPCDVILLDGGEFSTQGDWDALQHPDLKVVILDDTQVIKTHAIYEELKRSSEWIRVYENQVDRNGWAIFEHT